MTDTNMLKILSKENVFNTQFFFDMYHNNGSLLTDEGLRKRLQKLLKNGLINRVGRGLYAISTSVCENYSYCYSELAGEIANIMETHYLDVSFSIFETIQLNEFVNHQFAKNTLFLYVEEELMDFVFETLKCHYPGKVLIAPSIKVFHQYLTDNTIVILKQTTETPTSPHKSWHTPLEKVLVDLFAEKLISEIISYGEYSSIYEEAFAKYPIDESKMFRYARRRNAYDKIMSFIKAETNVALRVK